MNTDLAAQVRNPKSLAPDQITQVIERVNDYLNRSHDRYEPGDDRFFARLALIEAVKALEGQNYGIGAVAVEVTMNEVRIFSGRNSLVSGCPEIRAVLGDGSDGFTSIVGHAETVALIRSRIGEAPDITFQRNQNDKLRAMPE